MGSLTGAVAFERVSKCIHRFINIILIERLLYPDKYNQLAAHQAVLPIATSTQPSSFFKISS